MEKIRKVVICALYHEGDAKHVEDFCQHHLKYKLPIFICEVKEGNDSAVIFKTKKDVLCDVLEQSIKDFSFSEAKNKVLEYIKADVVFFLDIDERMTTRKDFVYEAIRRFENEDNLGALIVNICSHGIYKQNEKIDFEVTKSFRIFRGHLRFRNHVHEHVSWDATEKGFIAGESRVMLEHYGYTERTNLADKVLRNFQLLAKTFVEGFDETEAEIDRMQYNLNSLQKSLIDLHNMGLFNNAYFPK